MANITLKGIDIFSKNTALYIKNGKDFFTAKNIGLVLAKNGDGAHMKYKVDGTAYDTLYVQTGDGVMQEADRSMAYYPKMRVTCDRSGRSELFDFRDDDGFMFFNGWIGNGNLERTRYDLEDGEYDVELRYNSWAIIDIGLKSENVGFYSKDIAKFFNAYSVDNEPHENLVDKICPSKDKQEIGLTAISNLFKILKMNGLKLVYSDEDNCLGIINDVAVEGAERSDDDAVPHWVVVPILAGQNLTYVSEGWSFRLKK